MLIYGIKKLKLACSRQPEYRDPATLFGGPYTSAIGITVYGPPNEKGTHSAHQMLRAK